MPCYEINTMSVEFKAKHKAILLLALKKLGYQTRENNQEQIITNIFSFNLKTQKVSYPRGYENQINQIKRAYSQIVLEQVAKKRRWILKNKAENEFQLIKY